MAIANHWPIPLHRCCRCRATPLAIGAQAEPFVDFREVLRNLPESEQSHAIGRAAYQLLEAGKVKWEDIVTSVRVRPLYEIVAREKLSVTEMVKAGVNRSIAAEAFESVNTPVHQAAQRAVNELVGKLKGAGLTEEQIKQGFAEKMVQRVGPVLAPIPKAEKSKSPEPAITAGNVILERIKRGTAAASPIPDFGGNMNAFVLWVERTFPEDVVTRITRDDWKALAGFVYAQKDMRDILKRLGADVDRVLREAE